MIDYYADWSRTYPLVSIEDPLNEDDWEGWHAMTERLGDQGAARRRRPLRHQPRAPRRGIAEGTANAFLVKVNQIGSLTETLDAVDMAHRAGYRA
jgi:enolase